jgi:2-oxo-4-hydroxy-4-carboxy-5-ureidoimidazoline decarboxylase
LLRLLVGQAANREQSEETLKALAKGNEDYEKKFGFIFIVCATGKSADEMLQLLNERLPNDKEHEMVIAMDEQNKITQIRLQKLLA